MKKVELCKLEDLEPGTVRRFDVGKLPLVVVRLPDGRIRAMRDRCSHYGARLSLGKLQPKVVGDEVGERRFAEDGEVVLRCPWHGYEFDVDTGRCIADPMHQSVRTYRILVEDDTVFLDR